MGQEKGFVNHNGSPFISHILEALSSITDQILICTNQSEYGQFGYPCIPDEIPNCGPIGGIYTGLLHSKTEQNLVLSCDIPFINTPVLKNLIAQYSGKFDITHYTDNPLIGIYNKSIIASLRTSIYTRQLKLLALLSNLNVLKLPVSNEIAPLLKNINTMQQYKQTVRWN
ncbi:hypothetical protein AB832_04075 [Flavobacteriaceae bacterium (ex Bugula neritina AB1)]|nr:hypothetical protein AB832_04075 [Flavobacteriaceae bacterium (ex Bugula neritina AB1)]